MTQKPSILEQFWQELRRRKVLPFLIAYVAACFAIIEFFDITQNTFSIPENTLRLLYFIAAAGLPVVIFLPWYIYRKPKDVESGEQAPALKPQFQAEEKVLHNLPAQLTTFIGRKKEMETVKDLTNDHRLVTLTGAGGCGKTRLALEVAIQLVPEYENGVWFVDLAPTSDGQLVVKKITEVLGIAEVSNKSITDTLIEKLKDKKLLLILDNCEHLIKACCEIAVKLVQSIPGLKILATSREFLNIKGEKVWRVPSLSLIKPKDIIDIESAKESEAVMLFNERAQLNDPDFELVKENITEVITICNKVDGIPLALELVASRTRYMDPKLILERFVDRFDQLSSSDPVVSVRQQTLQSTIEWSYNLLKDNEKVLFRKLSVFTGGFDLTAVEEVCGNESLPKESILNLHSRLIDTCMIQTLNRTAGHMRYGMLETLRQFASKLLVENNETEEISSKHLDYFTRIAGQAYDERISSQAEWVDKIRLEHDNMLAALRWAELHKKEEFQLLAANLSWFWARSNDYSMAIEILEKVITSNNIDIGTQARLFTGYGSLLVTAGNPQKALDILKKGLSLWRELENKKEEALILAAIADLIYMMGDNETGLNYANEGYALAMELNDAAIELNCMIMVSFGLVCSKKTEEARSSTRKLLKLAEEIENYYLIMAAHHMLGDCALMDGIYHEAEREYGQGLETAHNSDDRSYTFVEMCGVAMSVAGQGRYAKALRINAAATNEAKSFGSWIPEDIPLVFWHELVIQLIVGTRKKLGEELTEKYEEEGRSMSFEEALEYALDFEKD